MNNKVEIRVFTDCIMIWVKDGADKMITSIEYISEKQIREICRDFDAYISLDERSEDFKFRENCNVIGVHPVEAEKIAERIGLDYQTLRKTIKALADEKH